MYIINTIRPAVVFCAITAGLISASIGSAETLSVGLRPHWSQVTQQQSDTANWTCSPPFTPAVISTQQGVKDARYNSRLRGTAREDARHVTVRRSGTIEPIDNTPGFRTGSIRQEYAAEESPVTIALELDLCVYRYLVDVVAMRYRLSGQILDYTASVSRGIDDSDASDVTLTYIPNKQAYLTDQGFALNRGRTVRRLGRLTADFLIADVRLTSENSTVELFVDINVNDMRMSVLPPVKHD